MLVEAAPPLVSFTFGLPEPAAAAALRNAGCTLVQTVTSAEEALQSLEAGMDALIVQSPDAGGHWGTFTPAQPPERLRLPDLVRAVRAAVDLPVMAVGGVGTSGDVAAALEAGAQAVAVGTLLLLASEAGTNPAHRAGFGAGPRRPGHDQRVQRPPRRRAAQRLPGGVRRPRPAGLPGAAPPHQPDPQGRGCGRGTRARQPVGRDRPPARRGPPRGRDPRKAGAVSVLRATSESGDAIEDPSEDALMVMFQGLEAGDGTFLIVEALTDPTGQTYVQAARGDDGAYVVEYRQGGADQHFQAHVADFREAHALVTMWAFRLPGLHERATWTRVTV